MSNFLPILFVVLGFLAMSGYLVAICADRRWLRKRLCLGSGALVVYYKDAAPSGEYDRVIAVEHIPAGVSSPFEKAAEHLLAKDWKAVNTASRISLWRRENGSMARVFALDILAEPIPLVTGFY